MQLKDTEGDAVTSMILPLGNPPPKAMSSVKAPLGMVSLHIQGTSLCGVLVCTCHADSSEQML